MAYATLATLKPLAPHITFTATSKPTADDVEGFLADVERFVNASLVTLGYVVPVTGPESVKLLGDMVAHGALARALRSRAFATNNAADTQGAALAQGVFDRQLKALGTAKEPFILPDAARTGAVVEKERAALSRLGGSGTPRPPMFTGDMEF